MFTLSLMYFGHSRGASNYKIFDNSFQLSAIDFSFHTFKDVFFRNILTNFYSNWSSGTATVVRFQKSNVLRPILYLCKNDHYFKFESQFNFLVNFAFPSFYVLKKSPRFLLHSNLYDLLLDKILDSFSLI